MANLAASAGDYHLEMKPKAEKVTPGQQRSQSAANLTSSWRIQLLKKASQQNEEEYRFGVRLVMFKSSALQHWLSYCNFLCLSFQKSRNSISTDLIRTVMQIKQFNICSCLKHVKCYVSDKVKKYTDKFKCLLSEENWINKSIQLSISSKSSTLPFPLAIVLQKCFFK